MANGWGVYDLSGNLVFDVDSVLSLKQSAKAKASTFPVELGSFAGFNKVLEPFQNKVRLAVNGLARVATFQAALDTELASTNLYNVVTPTKVYLNVTLESYGHDQTADNGGVSGLVVDLALLQIREVTPAYATAALPAAKCKNPTSASKQTGGKGQTQTPAAPPSRTMASVIAQADSDSNS